MASPLPPCGQAGPREPCSKLERRSPRHALLVGIAPVSDTGARAMLGRLSRLSAPGAPHRSRSSPSSCRPTSSSHPEGSAEACQAPRPEARCRLDQGGCSKEWPRSRPAVRRESAAQRRGSPRDRVALATAVRAPGTPATEVALRRDVRVTSAARIAEAAGGASESQDDAAAVLERGLAASRDAVDAVDAVDATAALAAMWSARMRYGEARRAMRPGHELGRPSRLALLRARWTGERRLGPSRKQFSLQCPECGAQRTSGFRPSLREPLGKLPEQKSAQGPLVSTALPTSYIS